MRCDFKLLMERKMGSTNWSLLLRLLLPDWPTEKEVSPSPRPKGHITVGAQGPAVVEGPPAALQGPTFPLDQVRRCEPSEGTCGTCPRPAR